MTINQLQDIATQGYRLFPLSKNTKIPLKNSNGVNDATTNHESLHWMYNRHPGCNWGIAGGHINDSEEFVIFVDVDTKTGKHGAEELKNLIDKYGPIPSTFTVTTPSGGYHYYFRTRIKHARYRSRLHGCRHIDLKCEGGYVVLFGSETDDGPYTPTSGALDKLAYLEDWFKNDTDTMIFGDIEKDYTRIGKIHLYDGQWAYFTSLAGKLRSDGLVDGDLFAALWDRAQQVGDPVPDQWWIRRIADGYSAYDDMFDATDRGNAQRFLATFGRDLLYVPSIGWFVWTGKQWMHDMEQLRVQELLASMVPTIKTQMTLIDKSDNKALMIQLAKSSKMLSGYTSRHNTLGYARSTSHLWHAPDDLDHNQKILNVQNGTINLETGHMEPHDPSMLCSRIASIDYRPNDECPLFLKFIDQITCGDQELADWLQTFFGYCMTGNTSEQLFTVFYGSGSNGKSVLVNVISHIMGSYALESPADTVLLKRTPSGNSNDLARIRGARLATVRETNQGKRLDESLVKSLTGGDRITARFLHKEFFEFVPVAKWILFTNHKPSIQGGDEGIWRRLRLIPFNLHVTPEEADRGLEAKLLNEAPGILNWLIAGAIRWHNYGLPNCQAIQEETNRYRNAEDVLYDFLDECTTSGATYKVEKRLVYLAYVEWCQKQGMRNLHKKTFAQKMEERDYYTIRGHKERYYSGLMLKKEYEISNSSTDF